MTETATKAGKQKGIYCDHDESRPIEQIRELNKMSDAVFTCRADVESIDRLKKAFVTTVRSYYSIDSIKIE